MLQNTNGAHAIGLLNISLATHIRGFADQGAPDEVVNQNFFSFVVQLGVSTAKMIVRTLILGLDNETLQWIGEGCGVDDLAASAHGLHSYSVLDANVFARKCLQAQGALAKGQER